MDEKLKEYFEKNNIEYKLYTHLPVFTVEESNKIEMTYKGMHTKSLFLRDENKNYYLISMEADKRLDIKYLESFFRVKKLKFTSPSELKDILKVSPGSVSIFCLINAKDNVTLILDEAIWNSELVAFHPNINTETIDIDHYNFSKFYNILKIKKLILKI